MCVCHMQGEKALEGAEGWGEVYDRGGCCFEILILCTPGKSLFFFLQMGQEQTFGILNVLEFSRYASLSCTWN